MTEVYLHGRMQRTRWLMIIAAFPVYVLLCAALAGWVCLLIMCESWTDLFDGLQVWTHLGHLRSSYWWTWFVLPTAVCAVLQILFLLPLFRHRPSQTHRGRHLLLSLLIGALLAGVLCGGVAMGILGALEEVLGRDSVPGPWKLIILTIVIVSWGFWSILVVIFAREPRPGRALGRMIALLFAGTAVELIAVIPLDIMVRRRSDCYCASPSYFALCLAGMMVLWLTGPVGIILLTSRRRRLWAQTHCEYCGYERGPTPGDKCPECGRQWACSTRNEKGD
jgi:hypothetical protein